MRVDIEMPELSAEIDEATLLGWLVAVGDEVAKGDPIAEIETDKATAELEADRDGRLVEIVVAAGTEGVKVGAGLGRIEVVEPDTAVEAESEAATRPASPEREPVQEPAPSSVEPTAGDGAPPPPTPLARRLSQQRGVALDALEGSGAHGRIVRSDVPQPALASPAAPEDRAAADAEGDVPFTLRRHSTMRRTIARRLSEAKQTIPHFYLRIRCGMDALLQVRETLLASREGLRVSVNDMLVRAAALALDDVPDANVSWREEGLVVYERVDVSVAVATPGGLIAPVLRDAAHKGLEQISEELRALASRAREGALRAEEYQGGTLTVSNLGMYGVETVYPIVNPPQACILGMGAAQQEPVVSGEGESARLEVGQVMACTLAADHRAVDGAVGARLLEAFRRRVEDPLSMVL